MKISNIILILFICVLFYFNSLMIVNEQRETYRTITELSKLVKDNYIIDKDLYIHIDFLYKEIKELQKENK